MKYENNCYYNPNKAVQFNIAAGFNYKKEYGEGGSYSLKQWQKRYGFDSNSFEADPLFMDAGSGDFRLQSGSACKNMGRYGPVGNKSETGKRDKSKARY